MTFAMVVRLPVSGTFGTDEDFDLRARLERDLHAALVEDSAGECGLGGTDAGFASISLEAITDPGVAFSLVKSVIGRYNLLNQVSVILETRDEEDPDDIQRQILWPLQPVSARVA